MFDAITAQWIALIPSTTTALLLCFGAVAGITAVATGARLVLEAFNSKQDDEDADEAEAGDDPDPDEPR